MKKRLFLIIRHLCLTNFPQKINVILVKDRQGLSFGTSECQHGKIAIEVNKYTVKSSKLFDFYTIDTSTC